MANIWKIIYHSQYSIDRERLFVSAENKETAERIAESHLEAVCDGRSGIDSVELSSSGEVLRLNVLNYKA